jgi:hypothetical protein
MQNILHFTMLETVSELGDTFIVFENFTASIGDLMVSD